MKLYSMRHTFSIFLLLASGVLFSQNYTVSGYITDSKSGETLIGASAYDSISKRGVVTNPYGFYSIRLPKGDACIKYSFVGNTAQMRKIYLRQDTVINIQLSETIELKEVVVTSSRSDIGVKGSQMSAIEVPIAQIKNIPPMMGEVDVIKALQLLPGVQSGSEGSAGLYVRGGGPDENLMLLDGVPLYNVNHMFGFFSVFNADAVKNVTLYKGSFPARFGGRLSSVVDVRTNDGNMKSYHGSASIGLLSAKINVEGPIWKDHTSFAVSARRTYFDILMQPIIPLIVKNNSDGENSGGGSNKTGYYFYDVNAKVNHKFSDRDRLFFSFYMGDDAIYANLKAVNRTRTSEPNEADPTQQKMVRSMTNKTKLNWAWGNLLTTLRWNHVFNSRLFANATAAYTQYKFLIDVNTSGTTKIYPERVPEFVTTIENDIGLGYRSNIYDWTGRIDFDWNPHHKHEIKYGGLYTNHRFAPGVSVLQVNVESSSIVSEPIGFKTDTVIKDPDILAHEMQLYFEDNYSINTYLKLNLGLHYSLFGKKQVYHDLQPRLSLRALINDDISVKMAYSYMSQYIHLLSNSDLSMPSDLWVPATERIKPMKSHQVAAGVFYNFLNKADLSIEGYYKTMNNVLEYREGASFLGSTSSWEEKVYQGRGWSYGVEFLLQRSFGKLTGWVGYTWSKTERKFDKPNQIINEGKPFYAKYDRRHDLSITATYSITDRIDVSSTFVWGTGNCGTLPLHTYQASVPLQDGYNPSEQSPFLPEGWHNSSQDFIPTRNNYRLPNYHRLDVGVNFHKKLKYGSQTWNVSVYNAYNQHNPFLVYTGYEKNQNVLKQLSIFPIMPSVSYTYKF